MNQRLRSVTVDGHTSIRHAEVELSYPNDRVRHVERALAATVDDPRFVPHLTLHETEAWGFRRS